MHSITTTSGFSSEKYFNNIFTSGEIARDSLKTKKFGINFFHLGPERDNYIFVEKEAQVLEFCRSFVLFSSNK